MPLYEYVCKKCGQRFEALVRAGEKTVCEKCGSPEVEKLLSAFAAVSSAGSRPPCAEVCPHAAGGGMPACGCGCGGHHHGH